MAKRKGNTKAKRRTVKRAKIVVSDDVTETAFETATTINPAVLAEVENQTGPPLTLLDLPGELLTRIIALECVTSGNGIARCTFYLRVNKHMKALAEDNSVTRAIYDTAFENRCAALQWLFDKSRTISEHFDKRIWSVMETVARDVETSAIDEGRLKLPCARHRHGHPSMSRLVFRQTVLKDVYHWAKCETKRQLGRLKRLRNAATDDESRAEWTRFVCTAVFARMVV